MTNKIFISYSKKDRNFAHHLANDLIAAGHNVWIDRSIKAGENWEAMIERQLEEADDVVVVLSPNAVESRWVQHEGSMAYGMKKNLFPVLYKRVSSESLPIWMKKFHYHDFIEGDYQKNFDEFSKNLLPPNPIQDLLDQQTEAYQKHGTLLSEAMYRLFEDNISSVKLNEEARELINNSKEIIDAQREHIQSLKMEAYLAKQKQRDFWRRLIFLGVIIFLSMLTVFTSLTTTFLTSLPINNLGGYNNPLEAFSLGDLLTGLKSLVSVLGIPIAMLVFDIGAYQSVGQTSKGIYSKDSSYRKYLYAIGLAFLGILVRVFPAKVGGNLSDQIENIIDPAWFYLTIVLLFALIFEQQKSLDGTWRVIVLGVVSGFAGTVLLSYPTIRYVYEKFLPTFVFTKSNGELMDYVLIALGALIPVGTGVIAGKWIRPALRKRKIIYSFILAGISFSLLAGLLIFPIMGIATNQPLYGVIVSRDGYSDLEWPLKLGEAVINSILFPAAVLQIGILIFAILIFIGLWLGSRRKDRGEVPSDKFDWFYISIASIPWVQFSTIVYYISYGLLDDVIMGIRPDLKLNILLGTGLFRFAPSVLTVGLLSIILSGLRKSEPKRIPRKWIDFLYFICVLSIGFYSTLILDSGFSGIKVFSLITVLLYIAIFISTIQRDRNYRKNPAAEEDIGYWKLCVASGVLSVIVNVPIISITLSLVMIPVVVLSEFFVAEEPVYTLEALEIIIDNHLLVSTGFPLALFFIIMIPITGLLFSVRAWPWRWVEWLWKKVKRSVPILQRVKRQY